MTCAGQLRCILSAFKTMSFK